MTKGIFILFLAASFLILLQFFLLPNIINGNDLNGNIVPLLHFKHSLLANHIFPFWNPYMNQGLPVTADPLYGIFNPLISIPMLLFNYQTAIKVTYFLSVFLACICMFFLARSYKISKSVSVILALSYAGTAYIEARVIAGHLEKVVSYPFLPLFLFCIIKLTIKINIFWSGCVALVLSLILFSGDIYNALYCLYALGAIFIYYLFTNRKIAFHLFLSVVLFILFSSIKILPMIELQSYISKIKEPFIGGLNIFSFFSNLFFPFDQLLSKIFGGPQILSTGFGWWESLVFIGPISILGLYFLINSFFKKRTSEVSILILLSLLFLLLSTPSSQLNPIHYIISYVSLLQYFHVPSRILAFWGMIILISFGLYLDSWKKRGWALTLLIINLLIIISFSQNLFATQNYGKVKSGYDAPLKWVSINNSNQYFTVHSTAQGEIPQDKAYINNILLLQSNYGLFIKNSLGEKYNFKGNNTYTDLQPGYIISNLSTKSAELKLIKKYENDIFLYKNSKAISFASINQKPQKATISANKIIVKSNDVGRNKLTILETYYPGWQAYVDNKKTKLLPGRFLSIKTQPRMHTYEFVFSPTKFIEAALLSALSVMIWGIYCYMRIKLRQMTI